MGNGLQDLLFGCITEQSQANILKKMTNATVQMVRKNGTAWHRPSLYVTSGRTQGGGYGCLAPNGCMIIHN